VIPFFAFPPPIRRVIHTTNAIESINARLRKIICQSARKRDPLSASKRDPFVVACAGSP
jgi:transposase-like protein